jgi:hypothetical protein
MVAPTMKPEGYGELIQKLLGRLSAEERLRGIPVEERLRGLSREQVVLAMPDEILRVLSDDYIQSLPAQLQHAIRERLGRRG